MVTDGEAEPELARLQHIGQQSDDHPAWQREQQPIPKADGKPAGLWNVAHEDLRPIFVATVYTTGAPRYSYMFARVGSGSLRRFRGRSRLGSTKSADGTTNWKFGVRPIGVNPRRETRPCGAGAAITRNFRKTHGAPLPARGPP